jgi:hypothetical protein
VHQPSLSFCRGRGRPNPLHGCLPPRRISPDRCRCCRRICGLTLAPLRGADLCGGGQPAGAHGCAVLPAGYPRAAPAGADRPPVVEATAGLSVARVGERRALLRHSGADVCARCQPPAWGAPSACFPRLPARTPHQQGRKRPTSAHALAGNKAAPTHPQDHEFSRTLRFAARGRASGAAARAGPHQAPAAASPEIVLRSREIEKRSPLFDLIRRPRAGAGRPVAPAGAERRAVGRQAILLIGLGMKEGGRSG